MHKCIMCKFKTEFKGNYETHLKTQKHMMKLKLSESNEIIKKMNKISVDDEIFNKKTENNQNDLVINSTIDKLLTVVTILSQKDEGIKNNKQNIETNEVKIENDVNEYAYVYKKQSYALINDAIKNPIVYINDDRDFSELVDNKKPSYFVEELLYEFEKKSLEKYIVEIITRCYVKENPLEQPSFATDTSRISFTCAIKDKETDIITWEKDIGGLKFNKYVVSRLIQFIIDRIDDNTKKIKNKIERLSNNNGSSKEITDLAKSLLNHADLVAYMKNKNFSSNIVRMVAPKLSFTNVKHVFVNKVITNYKADKIKN